MEVSGGEGGIRTHGDLATSPVFKTSAFNHSTTSPHSFFYNKPPIDATHAFKTGPFQTCAISQMRI